MFKLVYVSCEKHRLWGPPPRPLPSPLMFYAIPQQDPISCLGQAMCPRATYPHNQVVKAGDIWATKLAALRRRTGTSEGCTEQDVLNLEVWMSVGPLSVNSFTLPPFPFFSLFFSSQRVGFQFICPGASRGEMKQCTGGAADVQAPSSPSLPHGLPCPSPSYLLA